MCNIATQREQNNSKTMTEKEELKKEKAEISNKLQNLRNFKDSENFKKISADQMTLLNIQEKAMKTYSQCLLERIARMESDFENSE